MNDETQPIPVVADSRPGGRHTRPEGAERTPAEATGAERGSRGRAAARGRRAAGARGVPGPEPEAVAELHPASPPGTPDGHAAAVADADRPTDRFVPAVPASPRRAATRRAERTARRRSRQRVRLTGRILAAAGAVIVVTGTGAAYYTERSVDQGFTRSKAISEQDAAALDGDLNILLIGLDTRKDRNGNDLPKDVLDQLHAGDGSEGGYNANSLILVHIPKDLKKITAFSIPRDDYVPVTGIPGYDHVKVKEAYGLRKAYREQQLMNQGVKDQVELEKEGREAGRESIVNTVKAFTGVPINRFAEVSLVGFYDIANLLGGIDVCLNHAVDDSYYSGAVFPAGPQHLDASDALAFVRQRHELENGDLDRTHRQQAFLTAAAKRLKDGGTLTNLGSLQRLITLAQNDIVLSQGWNLVDFAQTMGRAGSIPIEFQTLPVLRYDTVDGQDVNVVDPAAIKRTVRAAFGVQTDPAPKTTPVSTVDVVNAGAPGGMAGKVSTSLSAKGFPKGTTGNAGYGDGSSSVVYFGTGADTDATQVADALGGLPTAASKNVEPGHVKVVIGTDFNLPDELTSSSSATGAAAATATESGAGTGTSAATTAASDDLPDSGKPVSTSIGSEIPCVN
ncbi:LCP family protein [Nocardia aurantia]|uniref:Transcriptional regulator LytR n=1 Tax=Nocardia aurantia TaxID=2585199 RepID=A0A7K0DXN4_9NOCA|nr:LCP family protein [Nocardia aurantia]MQY30475.1 Transcriptional regulator LytR [Nocardia aurantia]